MKAQKNKIVTTLDGERYIYEKLEGNNFPPHSDRDRSFGFIFDSKTNLLLTSQEPGIWELPGGSIEKGETPKDTLLREVYEETAVRVNESTLVNYYCTIGSKLDAKDNVLSQKKSYAFIGFVETIDEFKKDPGGEHKDRIFIPIDSFRDYYYWKDSVEEITVELKLAIQRLDIKT